MTREEFEEVYEANHQKALNAARRVSREYAEDGVADAAVYCLANLARFDRITPSYFIQLAVNRTRNAVERQHPDIISPVGTANDLAAVEEMEAEKADGRAYHSGKRSD